MSAGPGKFEGEPALAALAYYSMTMGGADQSTNLTDWFRKPFNFDADADAMEFARQKGYTEDEIAEALADDSYGLSLSEDEQGFVWLARYATEAEFNAALSKAEDAEGEEVEW